MDFELPAEIVAKLHELDEFIEREIKPLEARNIQYFDHRREYARRDGDFWIINGQKRYNSQAYRASADLVFARTSGRSGDADGITAFIVPMSAPGVDILYNHWTFNMPSDHPEVGFKDVRVPNS